MKPKPGTVAWYAEHPDALDAAVDNYLEDLIDSHQREVEQTQMLWEFGIDLRALWHSMPCHDAPPVQPEDFFRTRWEQVMESRCQKTVISTITVRTYYPGPHRDLVTWIDPVFYNDVADPLSLQRLDIAPVN